MLVLFHRNSNSVLFFSLNPDYFPRENVKNKTLSATETIVNNDWAIKRTSQMSVLHRNEFGINWPKAKHNKRDKLPDNCENIDANDTNDKNTIPLQTKEYFRLQANHDISNHTIRTIYDIFVFWCKKLSLLPIGLNGGKVYWGNNQDAKRSGSWFPIEGHCLVSTLCWCQLQNPSKN